jgi:GAF domain-containing protein
MVLRAQRNLPAPLAAKLHQPWDDGVSSLVMLSGEALSIHGEGLARFKLARLGKAALLAPIKVRDQPIGVISVARRAARPFSERDQAMLEAVADYASISLVNARLFQALEARAQRLQQMVEQTQTGVRVRAEWMAKLEGDLRAARDQLQRLSEQVSEPNIRSGLAAIGEDLVAILQRVGQALTASSEAPDESPSPRDPPGA